MNISRLVITEVLDKATPAQLEEQIKSGGSLVDLLREHEAKARFFKRIVQIDVDGPSLLRTIQRERPAYGFLLAVHRDWYDRQITELMRYVESL